MENLKMKELVEICEKLDLNFRCAKRKQAMLEIMRNAGVTPEEVDEGCADIKARSEEAERQAVHECKEAERRERREEAERQECLELKLIEFEVLHCSQAPSVASAIVQVSGQKIRDHLPPFVIVKAKAKYLDDDDDDVWRFVAHGPIDGQRAPLGRIISSSSKTSVSEMPWSGLFGCRTC